MLPFMKKNPNCSNTACYYLLKQTRLKLSPKVYEALILEDLDFQIAWQVSTTHIKMFNGVNEQYMPTLKSTLKRGRIGNFEIYFIWLKSK